MDAKSSVMLQIFQAAALWIAEQVMGAISNHVRQSASA